MSRISVILTCYNVQDYVATAMQSVLDCGFDDLELIVVDDCSSDRTRVVLDAVKAANPAVTIKPIYFSSNTVGGVASAANMGMDVATGEVVIFVDGDDWVIPHALREAVDQHLQTKPDFTVCNCLEYWNDTGRYAQYPEGHHWLELPKQHDPEARRKILLQMAPFPWRKIYQRGFLETHHIRFPVGDFFFEDNPFHWETTLKAEKFLFYAQPTHVHRMARATQTVTGIGAKSLKIFDHADTIRKTLKAEGSYETHEAVYLDWLLRHVIWCCAQLPAGFLNEAFELARSHLTELPAYSFWHALAVSGFNASDVRKVMAIYLNERFEFMREF